MFICKIIFAFSLGFILVGYLLSRLLKIKGWDILGSSFVISSLCIFYSTLILAYSPLTANFATLNSLIVGISIVLAYLLWREKIPFFETSSSKNSYKIERFASFAVIPFAVLILLRAFFQPMISPDSIFRWNHLAELLFREGGLSFYPPSTSNDFIKYPYPDGFPPLVSILYAYIYICAGKVIPQMTSIIVFAQFALCAYYVYKASLIFFKNKFAAQISLCALLASPTFFFSLFLGQETGWTSLSAAMFFYYAIKMAKSDKLDISSAVMCSVAIALGAISREYGLIFIALSVPILFLLNISPGQIMRCFSFAILISSPFYIRNFITFGNPIYPLSFFGFLHHNQIHQGIMTEYSRQFSLFSNVRYLFDALKFAAFGLPIQLLVLCLAWIKKHNIAFYFYCITIALLWAYSTNYTCGGIYYSMRVLSPAIIALSIIAGGSIANFATKFSIMEKLIKIAFIPILTFFFLIALTLPASPFKTPTKLWVNTAFGKNSGIEDMIFKYVTTIPSDSLILCDSALYQSQLYQRSDRRVKLIPIWTPELLFLFDEEISFHAKIAKLRAFGITHIMRTNDSANNNFFEHYSFFREYPEKIPEIIRGPDSRIFKI